MSEKDDKRRGDLLKLTSEIVSAYAGNNTLEGSTLPDLIGSIFAKLNELASDEKVLPETLTPAVPIRRSVTEDYIVCLEDGTKLKTLKRHLMRSHGMTPEEYRAKWGLRADYPMVAPNYAAKRKELAIKIGLGRKARVLEPEPAPTPVKRTRKKAVA